MPSWHYNVIWYALWWPPSSLPYQIYLLRQHIEVFLLVFKFLLSTSRCTVCTPITFQSKMHFQQWWNRKEASFRFSWAMTETCCPLLDVPLAFSLPGFLTTLQMSLTLLLVRTLSLSGLSSPCSLMSNLAALGLNPSRIYLSWSHKDIISGPCSWCTHWVLCVILQGIILWQSVPAQGIFIFAYSAFEFFSSSEQLAHS